MNRTVIRHTKFTSTGAVSKQQKNGPVDKYRRLLERQKIPFTETFNYIVAQAFEFNNPQRHEIVSIFEFKHNADKVNQTIGYMNVIKGSYDK